MTQPQTEMVELKACPLAQCNGRAELIYAPTGGCYIECTNCGLTTRVIQDDNDDAMNHDLAVRLWNTRTVAPDIQQLVEALERIGTRKLGGPFKGGQVVGERREMIEIARAALTTIEASRNDGAAIDAMSDVREALAKLVQDAYEEGVEDGIEAAAEPHLRDVAVPQWIDSVARIELLKFAALESPSGGGK